MKSRKNNELPLDKFINLSLYNKKFGYYMKKNPFGKKGDFITAPKISRLFSEMIAIWIISFWQSLGSPKKFNLVELGAGDGEMMKIIIESFKNFPDFFNACNIFIHEKSPKLIKIQKKKLLKNKIIWITKINKINEKPTIFIANEFFDAIAIKQLIKKKGLWVENFVNFNERKKPFLLQKKINIKKIEKKIGINISKDQKFIEFSPLMFQLIKEISNIINKRNGGLLIIDYGYFNKKMFDTLQSVKKHKKTHILNNVGNSDITHLLNYKLIKEIVKKFKLKTNGLTTQRKFLIKLGIIQRAEIISKNVPFSLKVDIYYRLRRLIDSKQMGDVFKVMFISNKKINFKLGF